MKNLILVIGRSGSGKDTLVRAAQKRFNASSVPSYTDRPIRPAEQDGIGHTFLTTEQFDEVMKSEHVLAYTKIGETGYRYCTTVEQIGRIKSDVVFYIIDPKGYYYFQDQREKLNMSVIYIYAPKSSRKERADKRNGNTVASWDKREVDENEQFNQFEEAEPCPWDDIVYNNGTIEEAVESFSEAVSLILDSCK